ncbi:MAG: hypothetical protein IPI60_17395 [Saprospiraceae bacterium]|nr:hypothetical protein [Saprospiraceae bacterium]
MKFILEEAASLKLQAPRKQPLLASSLWLLAKKPAAREQPAVGFWPLAVGEQPGCNCYKKTPNKELKA